MDGFKPYEVVVQKKVNGWFWVNFVSWGIVGLAIDAVAGSMYKLTPEQVNTSLTQVATGGPDDAVYIFVTMQPDPAWEKVGMLQRAR